MVVKTVLLKSCKNPDPLWVFTRTPMIYLIATTTDGPGGRTQFLRMLLVFMRTIGTVGG